MEDERIRVRERENTRPAEKTELREEKAGGTCPHCGAHFEEQHELCPVCGWKVVDYCTFCGARMLPSDVDCPECGMPSDGIVCQGCGIRNFRPFCRHCGQPLSRAARRAVEKAREDPGVKEAARLLVRISELQAELDSSSPDDVAEEPQGPTEGELRLKELMAKVGFTPAQDPKPAKRRIGRSREEVLAEYQKAVDDAARVFEEMLPPAGSTPQEQRNFYTSRKVAVTEVIEKTWYGIVVEDAMLWECNKCHVLHNNPMECAVREFGGTWIKGSHTEIVSADTPGAKKFTEKVGERKVYRRE